jgi:hypothetical protein
MKRGADLGIGLANLSDQVRLVDRDGTILGFMTVAEAQRRASQKAGELVTILRSDEMTIVRIVDDAAAFRLQALKQGIAGPPAPAGQPLRMATCPHCAGKFFFQNSEASRRIVRTLTHMQSPVVAQDRAILPFDCPRCNQHIFIEVFYER